MTYQIIQLLVRHAMTAAGVYLMNSGYVDATQVELLTGAAITIVGIGWSVLEKKVRGN